MEKAELAAVALRATAEPLLMIDEQGRLLFANAAAAELVLPPRNATGTARLRVAGRRRALHRLPLARAALRGEVVVDLEMRIERRDGTPLVVQGSAMALADAGGDVRGVVLGLHDVTALREMARQKDELLANVSHELRTPLAVVHTSLGVVLANAGPDLPEPLHRLLRNADEAAERMRVLVDNLLDLGRARAGRIRLARSRTDLRDLAARSAEAVRPLAAARGQRVELSVPSRPVCASVDRARLEQALWNLLGNAHKYGCEGGAIRLTVEQRGREALLTVSDDGPGIPPGDRVHVFERFYQGRRTRGSPSGGSGLGLPIARALVELHGGRLELIAAPGPGAAFRITLPAARGRGASAEEVA